MCILYVKPPSNSSFLSKNLTNFFRYYTNTLSENLTKRSQFVTLLSIVVYRRNGCRRVITLIMKDDSYKYKKVITIGTVSEITGLTERQIRYYEERKLIFPERTKKGTRKYSFHDVEQLMDIVEKMEEGAQTFEIRQDMLKKEKQLDDKAVRDKMIRGQLNARFGISKMP